MPPHLSHFHPEFLTSNRFPFHIGTWLRHRHIGKGRFFQDVVIALVKSPVPFKFPGLIASGPMKDGRMFGCFNSLTAPGTMGKHLQGQRKDGRNDVPAQGQGLPIVFKDQVQSVLIVVAERTLGYFFQYLPAVVMASPGRRN